MELTGNRWGMSREMTGNEQRIDGGTGTGNRLGMSGGRLTGH